MTSTIGRTVQGADGQASVEGVAGLERLCRVFGSAEYMEKKMQDWSNDVFFVELWTELQERVRQNKDEGRHVAGSMSVADVASRTSQAVTDEHHGGSSSGQYANSDGALFDETASAYRQLRLRSESIITSTVSSNALSALKPYSRISTWATLSTAPSSTTTSLPPSADLASTLRTLSANISFLSRALGVAPLRRITRQVLLPIQNSIWGNILMRNTFSAAGAAQLISDVDHLCSVVDAALGSIGHAGDSMRTMKKLNEGLLLLGLNAQKQDGTEEGGKEDGAVSAAGLWDVEKRLFKDNESAREVLAELEVESLTEAEARTVLEKRVEISS